MTLQVALISFGIALAAALGGVALQNLIERRREAKERRWPFQGDRLGRWPGAGAAHARRFISGELPEIDRLLVDLMRAMAKEP